MSKPTFKITGTIRSEQVLNAFIEVVRKNLPLNLKNTRITMEDVLYALAYANVHRSSIESACKELQGAPSGNRLREVITQALPDRAGWGNAGSIGSIVSNCIRAYGSASEISTLRLT